MFNGQPAYTLDHATQPTCTGKEVKPTFASSSIFVVGQALIRENDTCMMNNASTVGKYVTVDTASDMIVASLMPSKAEEAELTDEAD